jgi:hypothetical protein
LSQAISKQAPMPALTVSPYVDERLQRSRRARGIPN